MEALKILESKAQLDWDYDAGADVLYVSSGEPKAALGVDIGDGIVVRYDEPSQTVVGLTITGFRGRLERGLGT